MKEMFRPVNTCTHYFRRLAFSSVFGLLLALVFPASAQNANHGRVIVQFKGQDEAKIKDVIGKHGAKIKKRIRTGPMQGKGHPG